MEKRISNRKYRKSVVSQIVISFVGVMGIILILCWIGNNLFLERYYLYSRKNAITNAYYKLNEIVTDENLDTDEIETKLELLSEKDSTEILILNPDTQTEKYTGKDPSILRRDLWDHLFGHIDDDDPKTESFFSKNGETNETNAPDIQEREAIDDAIGKDNGLRIKGEKKEILISTDDYEMCISQDIRNGSEYIDLWGNLENDDLFIIRMPIESIQSSVSIANRFIGYIGLVELCVSILMIIFVTRKFTKPILELAEISGKMAELDFEAKYTSGGDNEIEFLGDNINKLSENLEYTIAELKSANIELQKDIEEKVQIDEMRREFLSNVSHELKTPIALIQGYAEGLQEGITDDPESMSYYCEVIVDEAAKMNSMVKKLLTLNQLEFGNDAVTMDRFDVAALIKSCVATTEILTKQNGITVDVPDDDSVYAWGDEFKAEEVLVNYLSNAINHCENEKRIEVKLEEKEDSIRVSVFNTGKNIPDESIEHVWEKFYKVDKARTRAYGGSGIGLSIVEAICKSMKQDYGVYNTDDGVTFWFELDRK